MSPSVTDIEYLLNIPHHTYSLWKDARCKAISMLRRPVGSASKTRLTEIFRSWDDFLNENYETTRTNDIFSLLLFYSIRIHFNDDNEQRKQIALSASRFIHNNHVEIQRATVQMYIWASEETPDTPTFLSNLVETAFDALGENGVRSIVGFLRLIKRSGRFLPVQVLEGVVSNESLFDTLLSSKDDEIRDTSISIISSVIREGLGKGKGKGYGEVVMSELIDRWHSSSLAKLEPKPSNVLIGPIRILHCLFDTRPRVLNKELPEIVEYLRVYAASGLEPLSITSFQFMLSIFKSDSTAISSENLRVLLKQLYKNCEDDQKSKNYYPLLWDYLRVFGVRVNLDDAISHIQQVRSENGLNTLAVVLSLFPDLHLPAHLLLTDQPSDALVKCVMMRTSLPDALIPRLRQHVIQGISSQENPAVTISALKLVSSLPSLMPSTKEVLNMVSSDNESIRLAAVSAVSNFDQEAVLKMAVYDPSDEVRAAAAMSLKPTAELSLNPSVIHLLCDKCQKVQKTAFTLIKQLCQFNPFDLETPLEDAVMRTFSDIYAVPDIPSMAERAMMLPSVSLVSPPRLTPMLVETANFCVSSAPRWISDSRFCDTRDSYTLESLANLGERGKPYLKDILEIFLKVFDNSRSRKVISSAAKSLTRFASGISNGINIRVECPTLVSALLSLLSVGSPREVVTALAATCDVVEIPQVTSLDFGTDADTAAFSALVGSLPSPEAFEAITEGISPSVAAFAQTILNSALSVQGHGKGKVSAMKCAAAVARACPIESKPFAEELITAATDSLETEYGVPLALAVIEGFVGGIGEASRRLFRRSLSLASATGDTSLFRLLAFSVIYHGQPLGPALSVAEEVASFAPSAVFTFLSLLSETGSLGFYSARADLLLKSIEGRHQCALSFSEHTEDNLETRRVFETLENPSELNQETWLSKLTTTLISSSPSRPMRACRDLPSSIRSRLLPSAFLSCWQISTPEGRDKFSQIIHHVAHTFHSLSTTLSLSLSRLAEVADRANLPFHVDDLKLASLGGDRPLSLFFLQRLRLDVPSSRTALERLLKLNASMGRISSARGILAGDASLLGTEAAANWSESLGEWEKALSLHMAAKSPFTAIARCLSHLERWDTVCSLEGSFLSGTREQQGMVARHFARAFIHTGQTSKAVRALSLLPLSPLPEDLAVAAFCYIKSGDYGKAAQAINDGLERVSRETSVFASGDETLINQKIDSARDLVEIAEAAEAKISGERERIWNNRLKGFERDSDAWIRLIEYRSLVIDPSRYSHVFLKMISALRRERKWKTIDAYFERLFTLSIAPEVELTHSKILISKGKRENAEKILRRVVAIGDCNTPEDFISKIESFDEGFAGKAVAFLTRDPKLKNAGLNSEGNPLLYLAKKMPETVFRMISQIYRTGSDITARILRTLGEVISSDKTITNNKLAEAVEYFDRSRTLSQGKEKPWARWAYANARLSDLDPEHRDVHLLKAVEGFLEVSVARPASIEYLCQLFSAVFRLSHVSLIPERILNRLIGLEPSSLIKVINQISAHLSHPDTSLRDLANRILMNFGELHFQALFYPLRVYTHGNDILRASTAKDMLAKLAMNHREEYNDCDVLSDGLAKATTSWFEMAAETLKCALSSLSLLRPTLTKFLDTIKSPTCNFDKMFISRYEKQINEIRRLMELKGSDDQLAELVNSFRQAVSDRVNKLEMILLPKVHPELSQMKNFVIAVPGCYNVNGSWPKIDIIDQCLSVLNTQQHPRCVTMRDHNGNRWKFLLKGSEDLRLDQRVMQMFSLMNSLLSRVGKTSIVEYAVVPLSPSAGLIAWVEGADTLHQIIGDMRAAQGESNGKESAVMSSFIGQFAGVASSLQRVELLGEIEKKCPADEIRKTFWLKAPNAATWLHRVETFTMSTALMSMVGYIVGLGDRHPSNIMILRHTGSVIHIDFGDSFEKNLLREDFPERVPFRLTRMILNALDGGTYEGMFRKTSEDVMRVMRENSSSILSQLEIFVHEPLEQAKGLDSQRVVERVSEKLSGTDNLFDDAVADCVGLDVETHVDQLIRIASDRYKYASHYLGWCFFW